ncbi:hypothetical protein C0R02_11675 [Streptomyces albidoflavus]|nr:hypothetical protein C0R02_11675 [Streptomyces albidoflavus]
MPAFARAGSLTGLNRRPGCHWPGLRFDRAGQRRPQSPAGLLVAGLRFDRAGQRWPQAPAGLGLGRRWLGFAPACPPRPCGSLMASSAGRAECVPGSTPTYRPCPCGSLMASIAGRAVRFAVSPVRGWGGAAPGYLLTNCMVRGQLEYGGRVCSLLRGHPDTTPPHGLVRGRPPEGG